MEHPESHVAASVAAYAPHVEAYALSTAHKVSGELARFAGTLAACSRVLDAGCGPGRDLVRLTALGLEAHGVDMSPEFVLRSRSALAEYLVSVDAVDAQQVANDRVVVGDLRKLPFPTDSFAASWACASLVHLSQGEALQALGELNRVTLQGGPLWVPLKAAPLGAETVGGWVDSVHGRRWFLRWHPDDLCAVAQEAGLQEVQVERDHNKEWVNLTARAA